MASIGFGTDGFIDSDENITVAVSSAVSGEPFAFVNGTNKAVNVILRVGNEAVEVVSSLGPHARAFVDGDPFVLEPWTSMTVFVTNTDSTGHTIGFTPDTSAKHVINNVTGSLYVQQVS